MLNTSPLDEASRGASFEASRGSFEASPLDEASRGASFEASRGSFEASPLDEASRGASFEASRGSFEASPLDEASRGASFEASPSYETQQTELSKVPFIDSHCHLDLLFERSLHTGTFEVFRKKTANFPMNYSGCVAVFCQPKAWPSYVSESKFHIKLLYFFK